MIRITVVGIGYVGLSLALLLAKRNKIMMLDIDRGKVEALNSRNIVIKDQEVTEYLHRKDIHIEATIDTRKAYDTADYIIIATPTDYNPYTNSLDTTSVEKTIESVLTINTKATIIIKSTIPLGFTRKLKSKYKIDNLIFSPEFLREGMALKDSLYPSRIIVGERSDRATQFAQLLISGAQKKDVPVLYTDSDEAELIKLFSNAYLAMRVAFFNEIDTLAEHKGLRSDDIINGVCLDPRIGQHYNNPSFGYGGYCLPKDIRQIVAQFNGIASNLIPAIYDSNRSRKEHIFNMILKENPKVIGIYRLVMKQNSDNFRDSAVIDIIKMLKDYGCEVLIYEPFCHDKTLLNCELIKELTQLDERCDIVVANRSSKELAVFKSKIYSRDLFGVN